MKSTVTIEIEVPVEFTPCKGYQQTMWEPGEPAHIDDLDFNEAEVLKLVEKALEDPEIESTLLDEANQAGIEYEMDRAEYLYDQMKDRELEGI